MYQHNWNDSDPIIDKCKGCDLITKRILDKVILCCYSFHPETEWLLGPCPRATHIKKED